MCTKSLNFLKNTGFPDFSPETRIFHFRNFRKFRISEKSENSGKFRKFRYFSNSLIGIDYCSKFQVKSMIGTKVMAKSFCEDMTRNFRKFVGWFQLMANNFGCGHVNSTKICKNVSKRPIIKVANYEVQSINTKKVIKTYVGGGGGHFCPPPPPRHTE